MYSRDLPKSSSILRKSSNTWKPIPCVQFTEVVLRHSNIRNQNQSLGMICPRDPHQRNPNAPKFKERSQQETQWQEQRTRKAAWRLAKNIPKYFLRRHNLRRLGVCLRHQPLKPEAKEFVVDSGALMHMISKKDLNSAELETVTTSRSPTTVITTNGKCRRMKRQLCMSKNWIYA